MSAESKSRVKYPSKNVNLCLKTGQSPKKGHLMYIPSLTAATFSPISRWGGWVSVGGGGKAAKQGKSPFTAKIRPFIC